MFQDVKTAIDVIERRCNKSHGLGPIITFMAELNDPQDQLKIIHVAGTNGKGSTVNNLRSILQTAGYKVGTFTSPYLEKHQDRIRINDEFIDDNELLAYFNRYFDRWCELELSMFEIDTAIAFLYCFDHQVDYMVLETGLGGLYDSTNIIKHPLMSLITNIGMDHMAILGDTYELIAKQKAGIIKANSLFLCAEQKDACKAVFKQTCVAMQTPYHEITSASNVSLRDGHMHFDYREYHDLVLASAARYQVDNAALAIDAIALLNAHQMVSVNEQQLRDGLFHANWKGRFEVISQDPLVIIDGAHNPQGMAALCRSLQGFDQIHVLFSALRDKKCDDMIEQLLEITKDISVTTFDFYRASDVMKLGEGYPVTHIADYKAAIEDGLAKPGTFVITGSLYFISVVRAYLQQRKESLLSEDR